MDWAHQWCAWNLFTYDWCSAPTASATSRDYSQGNFHRCHSTTHGICVPSLEWRINPKPTKTTRFILQETWDSPASTTDSIRLSLSGSALQDEIKSCTAVLMHTSSPRVSATMGYSFRKSGYPVPATRKSSTLASFVPRSIVLWNALPKEIQEPNTLTKFKTRPRTHLHIWCQQSHLFIFN